MFSFARKALLWLAAAAVKAQDELAALGLDRRLASHALPNIRAKENIRYELAPTTITLDIDRPSHGRLIIARAEGQATASPVSSAAM